MKKTFYSILIITLLIFAAFAVCLSAVGANESFAVAEREEDYYYDVTDYAVDEQIEMYLNETVTPSRVFSSVTYADSIVIHDPDMLEFVNDEFIPRKTGVTYVSYVTPALDEHGDTVAVCRNRSVVIYDGARNVSGYATRRDSAVTSEYLLGATYDLDLATGTGCDYRELDVRLSSATPNEEGSYHPVGQFIELSADMKRFKVVGIGKVRIEV